MPKITATTRLFLRTRGALDLDGWMCWTFPEYGATSARSERGEHLREWTIRESPSGVRLGRLQRRDANGSLHTRALRRIEEDHLMKFAIR